MPRPPKGKGAANTPEQDEALVAALSAFLRADKTITTPIRWLEDESGKMHFSRTLDIEGVTEASLILFGRAEAKLPDCHVTLGLRWEDPSGRRGHFERLDWRPKDEHTNLGIGPSELHFLLIEGTHHHRLAHNATHPLGLGLAMHLNLPIAIPVEPEPGWQNFLAVAAQWWRIHDLVRTPPPPWEYDLLTFPRAGGNNQ